MENGQEFEIPLDSPLDVNSENMLVSASQPKLYFNRQKLLGSILSNSIRYEQDGWFAGWWVHNFKLINHGNHKLYEIDEKGNKTEKDFDLSFVNKGFKVYKLLIDKRYELEFITETIFELLNGNAKCEELNETKVKVTISLKKGDFSFIFDKKGNKNLFEAEQQDALDKYDIVCFLSNGKIYFKLQPKKGNNYFIFKNYFSPENYTYEQNENIGIWTDKKNKKFKWKIKQEGNKYKIEDFYEKRILLVSPKDKDVLFQGNEIHYSLKDFSKFRVSFALDFLYYKGYFTEAKIQLSNSKDFNLNKTSEELSNKISVSLLKDYTDKVAYNSPTALIKLDIPCWYSLGFQFKIFNCTENEEDYDFKNDDFDFRVSCKIKAYRVDIHHKKSSFVSFFNNNNNKVKAKKIISCSYNMNKLYEVDKNYLLESLNKIDFNYRGVVFNLGKYSYNGVPFELNPKYDPTKPITTGDKYGYVPNFSYDWSQPPNEENLPWKPNPNYKEDGTYEDNCPWKVIISRSKIIRVELGEFVGFTNETGADIYKTKEFFIYNPDRYDYKIEDLAKENKNFSYYVNGYVFVKSHLVYKVNNNGIIEVANIENRAKKDQPQTNKDTYIYKWYRNGKINSWYDTYSNGILFNQKDLNQQGLKNYELFKWYFIYKDNISAVADINPFENPLFDSVLRNYLVSIDVPEAESKRFSISSFINSAYFEKLNEYLNDLSYCIYLKESFNKIVKKEIRNFLNFNATFYLSFRLLMNEIEMFKLSSNVSIDNMDDFKRSLINIDKTNAISKVREYFEQELKRYNYFDFLFNFFCVHFQDGLSYLENEYKTFDADSHSFLYQLFVNDERCNKYYYSNMRPDAVKILTRLANVEDKEQDISAYNTLEKYTGFFGNLLLPKYKMETAKIKYGKEVRNAQLINTFEIESEGLLNKDYLEQVICGKHFAYCMNKIFFTVEEKKKIDHKKFYRPFFPFINSWFDNCVTVDDEGYHSFVIPLCFKSCILKHVALKSDSFLKKNDTLEFSNKENFETLFDKILCCNKAQAILNNKSFIKAEGFLSCEDSKSVVNFELKQFFYKTSGFEKARSDELKQNDTRTVTVFNPEAFNSLPDFCFINNKAMVKTNSLEKELISSLAIDLIMNISSFDIVKDCFFQSIKDKARHNLQISFKSKIDLSYKLDYLDKKIFFVEHKEINSKQKFVSQLSNLIIDNSNNYSIVNDEDKYKEYFQDNDEPKFYVQLAYNNVKNYFIQYIMLEFKNSNCYINLKHWLQDNNKFELSDTIDINSKDEKVLDSSYKNNSSDDFKISLAYLKEINNSIEVLKVEKEDDFKSYLLSIKGFSLFFKDFNEYIFKFGLASIIETSGDIKDLQLASIKDNKLIATNKNDKIILDILKLRALEYKGYNYLGYDKLSTDTKKFYFCFQDSCEFYLLQKGIIKGLYKNDKQISFKDNILEFVLSNKKYRFELDKSGTSTIDYYVTDVRDTKEKVIYKRDTKDVFTYVKQFWSNTEEIEKFWWYDKDTVVELTQTHFNIYKKTDEIDDWMGDKWKLDKTIDRHSIIKSDILYYNMSDAFGNDSKPIFFMLKDDNNRIELSFVDLTILTENEDFNKGLIKNKIISINWLEFGTDGSSNVLNTYNRFVISSMIKEAKISSTVIDDVFMLGIAYKKGLNQWTVVIDKIGNYIKQVIWGYGYVGNNGTLTGGQLPINCVNETNGFNRKVNHIKELKDKDRIPNEVYGEDSSIFFVFEKIDGIVSHFIFKNNKFIKQVLLLKSNYDTQYVNNSQYYCAYYNTVPKNLELKPQDPFIPAKVWIFYSRVVQILFKYTGAFLYRHLWYILFSYINQASGSYAYTWKNSSIPDEHGKTKPYDKLVYSKDHKVEISYDPYELGFPYRIMLATLENQGEIAKKTTYESDLSINEGEQGKLSSDETSIEKNKPGLFYKANTDSIISNSMHQNGLAVYMASTIVEMATLDMFYSINDKIQCYAGPGFVNHKFVGLCYAQSVSDVQLDVKHIDYFISFLDSVREALIQAATWIKMAADAIFVTADFSSRVHIVAFGTDTGLSQSIAIGIAAAGSILMAAYWPLKLAADIVESIINILCLRRTAAHIQSTLAKYKLDIEAKHRYGQRSMEFMYPAFGANIIDFTDESVLAEVTNTQKSLKIDKSKLDEDTALRALALSKNYFSDNNNIPFSLSEPYFTISSVKCKGQQDKVYAPNGMAVVEGTTSLLETESFVNKDIGVPEPVFTQPIIHDYEINKQWKIGFTAIAGQIISVSQDDTKILDGAPSNMVITDDFCGIASSYVAVEVKNSFDLDYLRPVAITPTCIALNINKVNCIQNGQYYHAFDGQSNRIVSWKGTIGCDREYAWQQYLFQKNDHFKRSSIFPPSHFMGSFTQEPIVALDAVDPIFNDIQSNTLQEGIENDIVGEQKNLKRYSIPVLSEPISSLPAMVRTLGPYKLNVVEGVTSLTTDLRTTQSDYKAPKSIDFNINGATFRATDEFICSLKAEHGTFRIEDVVATEGMEFIGATTEVAYFYSSATRLYYSFTGSNITKEQILFRFKDVTDGKWDFVNQEVIITTLLSNEESFIVRLDKDMLGEIYPPIETIKDKESGFKVMSMPAGLVYQGPKRCIVNRFVVNDYMYKDIKDNKRKWDKLDKEKFELERDYNWYYESIIEPKKIKNKNKSTYYLEGWTHNPFKLATTMLGLNEETDCKFEWSITFVWTKDFDTLYDSNEYSMVCFQGETITEGGVKLGEVTHLPLYKELFTRSGDSGYYTFQFQSGNGIGNRERLYIWCDGLIAIKSIKLSCKEMTSRRTQPLTTYIDVKDMQEQ